MSRCPLCAGSELSDHARHRRRTLWHCECCGLLFLGAEAHPSPEAAAERYRLHRNSLDDAGYVRMLRTLIDPVLARVASGARGLDYGSGPRPVAAELVRREGFKCDAYDPVFAPEPPRPPYEFVLACEVAEHFLDPAAEFARLRSLVAPGGLLGVRTEFWSEAADLVKPAAPATWHYLSDPTHVVFYREKCFRWLAAHGHWTMEWSDGRRLVLLRRPSE